MRVLIGCDFTQPIAAEDLLTQMPASGEIESYTQTAIKTRPEFAQLEVALSVAEQDIKLARSERRPQVTYSLNGGFVSDSLKPANLRDHAGGSAQIGVSLPMFDYGGLYAEQQASFRELAISLALAVVLVFLVLLIEFRSFAHPAAIVTGAVLALSGVLLALFITKTTLNVVSLTGMIMVVGIVAKNGILMLDAVEENLEKTKNLTEALIVSGRRRFRPVLMTSLAAILGMLPLALAVGAGSELLQPLAIAVIGGLIFALLFSLVVTPTGYALLQNPKSGAQLK